MEVCPATLNTECGDGTGTGNPQHKDMGPPRYIGSPVCVGSPGFQSVRRAAAVNSASLGPNGYGGLNTWRPTVSSAERENLGRHARRNHRVFAGLKRTVQRTVLPNVISPANHVAAYGNTWALLADY